jgi:RNA polymerase sigma factor (TIGR02999 family)
MAQTRDATAILDTASAGDPAGAAELFGLVYGELRAMAERCMRQERAGHTLQPTALVHEAFLKLIDQTRASWEGRTHFLGVAAGAMRRILVDHARGHNAQKRGGDRRRVEVDSAIIDTHRPREDVLAIDGALARLEALNPRHARIVELRFFGGLTIPETAAALGVGTTTVEEGWAVARAWLRRELESAA